MMMIDHEMKSVSSFSVVFTIQIVSSFIHNNINVLHSWRFKYLSDPSLLICTVCTNSQTYWEKRVFVHLKKCQDTHSSVVNISRFWEVIECLSKFCKMMNNISFHQIKFSLILHLFQSQKSWLCNFCSFVNTAELKMRVYVKIKHQNWSCLLKEWFHYQTCLIQQYHIYHRAEVYFVVISLSVNEISFNSLRFSSMTVSSSISLLADMTTDHKDFIEIWQALDQQIIIWIQLWKRIKVNEWDRVINFKQHLNSINFNALLTVFLTVVKSDCWRKECVIDVMKSLEYKCQQCVCNFSCLMQCIIASSSLSSINDELWQLQNKMYVQYCQKVVKLILYMLWLHVKCLSYDVFRLKLILNQKSWLKWFNQTLSEIEQKFKANAADSSQRDKKLCLIFFTQHQQIFGLLVEIMKSLFMFMTLWHNQFEYAVIHWLTVNIFCADDWMLKTKKYTLKLAFYLYWIWLIIIYYIHRIYEQQICSDKKQMRILYKYHCKYLCNSSLSSVNEILFLLTQDRRQVKKQLSHEAVY